MYAGVFGPTEAKAHQRLSDESVLIVNFALPTGQAPLRETESILRQTLEPLILRSQNPMCAIELSLQVVNDDGSLLAASVNAALSALVDAGVPMRGQAAAVTCAVSADGALLLDPTRAEEAAAAACVTLVVDAAGGILASFCTGSPPRHTDALLCRTRVCAERSRLRCWDRRQLYWRPVSVEPRREQRANSASSRKEHAHQLPGKSTRIFARNEHAPHRPMAGLRHPPPPPSRPSHSRPSRRRI